MACEPQPLQMTAPAGLSRTQFLIASHAVGLPLFPSVCGDHGGLVSNSRQHTNTVHATSSVDYMEGLHCSTYSATADAARVMPASQEQMLAVV
jgi:hypothetical protein